MAKKKISSDESFMKELACATGGEVLDDVETVKYFIDTGSLAINYISSGKFIGGGIPGARITELYGPSASSKSLLGSNLLFGIQRMGGISILIDTENAANKEFIVRASHADPKKINRYKTVSLEACFAKIHSIINFVRDKRPDTPVLIVYDSLSVSPTARELKEVDLPEKYSKAQFKTIVGGKEQPGERAKVCSKELRKLNGLMEKVNTNCTVVFMNQTRSQIGVMYGSPETKGGGGNALTFYASLILRTQTQKKIEQKMTAKKKRILGVNVKIQNKKNRSYRPFVETDGIKLLFEHGINPLSGLLSLLMDCKRISIAGKGSFLVNPEYSNGEEVRFKANLDENNVPVDVFMKCPALLDAKTAEEITEYLEPFQVALNFANDETIIETSVGEDEEDSIADEIDELLEMEAEEETEEEELVE